MSITVGLEACRNAIFRGQKNVKFVLLSRNFCLVACCQGREKSSNQEVSKRGLVKPQPYLKFEDLILLFKNTFSKLLSLSPWVLTLVEMPSLEAKRMSTFLIVKEFVFFEKVIFVNLNKITFNPFRIKL